jgi:hypothetical protein
MDDFPYRTAYMPPFADMFHRLQDIAINPPAKWREPCKNFPLGIVRRYYPNDYEQTDSLTDHFVEPARIRCREIWNKSPYDTWQDMKAKTVPAFFEKMSLHERREAVYAESHGCNLFNVALGTYSINRVVDRRAAVNGLAVLDCTAGWGDRLVAAYAMPSVCFYRGWDTNPDLQPVYRALSAACVDAGAHALDWKIECVPFELQRDRFLSRSSEYHERFDVAMVAPPFYDQELYTGENTSTNLYRTESAWYTWFYRPLLKQAYCALKPGGVVIAYIKKDRMVREAQHELQRMGMKYEGVLGFRQTHNGEQRPRTRNTFIWRK